MITKLYIHGSGVSGLRRNLIVKLRPVRQHTSPRRLIVSCVGDWLSRSCVGDWLFRSCVGDSLSRSCVGDWLSGSCVGDWLFWSFVLMTPTWRLMSVQCLVVFIVFSPLQASTRSRHVLKGLAAQRLREDTYQAIYAQSDDTVMLISNL